MHSSPRGFSLLEVTLALGISGILLSGMWQLTSVAGTQREIATITSQIKAVTAAAQNYAAAQRTTLLALPQLAALDGVARVKVTASDTGDTATSLQDSAFLPRDFVNRNSYGQTYAVFVRREDAGTLGVADSGDRLAILLISTGGDTINDVMGAKIAGSAGAAGGFIYRSDNPAPPAAATRARGTAGGWAIDLTLAGWSGIGSVAQAGRIAALANFMPAGTSTGGGAQNLNALDDGATEYTSLYNVYAGQEAGAANTLSGRNTAFGYQAQRNMAPVVADGNNTSFGYQALMGWTGGTTGTDNVAVGAYALTNAASMSRNVAIGVSSSWNMTTGDDRVTVGYASGISCLGSNIIAIGGYTGGFTSGSGDCTGSLFVGTQVARFSAGTYNTLVGHYSGYQGSGNYNTSFGYRALLSLSSLAVNNTAIGWQAGDSITTGNNNIMIGQNVDPPLSTSSNQINIGNVIFGDTSTGQIAIGSGTLATGISFDVGARTDSVRFAAGTTAQRPTCDATTIGAQRWNTTDSVLEVCGGSGWARPITMPTTVATSTPAPNDGYFVLTTGSWDGNLGGAVGANDKCYNDLNVNDWRGKATAISNGQLDRAHIKAFICMSHGSNSSFCAGAVPGARYYFATSGDPSAGGASFTTDNDGYGPYDNALWSGVSYFNIADYYWSNRTAPSTTYWGMNETSWANAGGSACLSFTSNSSSEFALPGYTGANDHVRWRWGGYGNGRTCEKLARLVCFVHP